MDSSNAAKLKLTAAQFRMLQRIPDEGLTPVALRQGRNSSVMAQIRTLRDLRFMWLVVETEDEYGIRYEITDAGRRLVDPDGGQ